MMTIAIIDFFLGAVLFFLINWIGSHSYPIGYTKLSLYPQTDKYLGFNFILKVVGPIIYLIVIASVFYRLGLDYLIIDIYLISVYYVIIRIVMIIITDKTKFVSWFRYIFFQSLVIVGSYLVYENLIVKKANITPDFSSIANELWIIIAVFLYHIINSIEFSNANSIKKKENYIREKYENFNKIFGHKIKTKLLNHKLEALFFAIMIYEDFNRPKIVRMCEYLSFFICMKKKPHTLGIMQYKTWSFINDDKSVSLALDKVRDSHVRLRSYYLNIKSSNNHSSHEWSLVSDLIRDYNGGDTYCGEVSEIYDKVVDIFYKDTKDDLLENYSYDKMKNLFF